MMRQSRLKKILMMLVLVAIASPALAGLIYTWEEWDPDSRTPASGPSATGKIKFADGVSFYDFEDEVVTFLFTTPEGQDFDESFAFEALAGVEVGGEFLCFSTCFPEKKAKKKAIKKLPASEKFLRFQRTVREPVMDSLMDWDAGYSTEPIAFDTHTEEESGFGRWVRVPEPPAVFLLLAGLGLIAFVRRRLAGR